VLLLALGLGVALVPNDVPGFAPPDGAMHDGDPHPAGMDMMR
jgi:hypothetical protein